MKKTEFTAARLTPQTMRRLDDLAAMLEASRSAVLSMLINSARVEGRPKISIDVEAKNNRYDAKVSQDVSVIAVGM